MTKNRQSRLCGLSLVDISVYRMIFYEEMDKLVLEPVLCLERFEKWLGSSGAIWRNADCTHIETGWQEDRGTPRLCTYSQQKPFSNDELAPQKPIKNPLRPW